MIRNKQPQAFITTILCCAFLSFPLTIPDEVHPAYDLYTIRPDGFDPPATTLGFNSKNELLITTYNIGSGHNYEMPGEVFLLRGTEGTDRNNIEVIEFANGFQDPVGLLVSNDSVYVVSRGEVVVVYDEDGDGKSDFRKVIYKIETYDERMWSYGLVAWDNHFYVMNSCHMTTGGNGTSGTSSKPMRGVIYRFDGEGNTEVIAGGVRQPNGLTISPKGEIFGTDNQGEWLPSSKLFHVKKGRYFGHPQIHLSATPWDESIPESPPAVWAVHDEIAWSPTYPSFVKTGLYKGQILAGDNNFGGIQRYFLERVKGEYQGAIFQFTGGLEVGMNDIREGPDGSLYMGGIGDGGQGRGAWGWKRTRWGLQKLVPNGKIAFEMLAIRSKENGFEIEFTKAPGPAALSASNYRLDRAGFAPAAGYGEGNMVQRRNIQVSSVEKVTENRYLLTLAPGDLEHSASLSLKSTVFHFRLNNIESVESEKLWSNEAWYTLNLKGPAEKVGCLESKYGNYDPSAEYDDGFRCDESVPTKKATNHSLSKNNIQFLNGHLLFINLPTQTSYDISITDISGKGQYRERITGTNRKTIDCFFLKPGIYLVKLSSDIHFLTEKIVIP